MPTTNHTVTITINGIDRTASLLRDSLYIRTSLENKSDVAEFVLKEFVPEDRDKVSISVNGTTVFGGYIISRTIESLGVRPKTLFTKCEVKDWSISLDSVIVTQSFTEKSDKETIAELFDGFNDFDASTHVNMLDADLDIEFTNVSLRESLNTLAQRVGAKWYISPDKDVYWFSPSSPSNAAFNIDVANPNGSSTFDIVNNSLQVSIDSSTIVNQVIINGGTKASETKVIDTIAANGTDKSFSGLTQLVDSVLFVTYTDTADNSYTVWGSFVGYAPDDRLVSEGGNYTVVIGTSRKSFKVEGTGGLAPKNGTNIVLHYYYKESIAVTVDDVDSQSIYGVLSQSITNTEFSSEAQATAIAQAIIDENKIGRKTISFDVFEHGLLPGTLITLDIPDVGIGATSGNFLLLENSDNLLLENGDDYLEEAGGNSESYLINEVSYVPQVTASGTFLIVAKISVDKYQKSLIDTLAKLKDLQTNSGNTANTPTTSRLSNFSSNLGEVVVGRAVFTDGGTAKFNWGTPNGATGAVIGLEDNGSSAYGAVYIYDEGTVKAKLGRLNDVPAIGTIQPTGWGLYTTNGFFSGTVGASYINGGTITGHQITGNTITGGTVTGSLISGGTVTGSTITGNLIIGGTIATSTPPINSSNPGVHLDSTGLYGYGSAGLTFRLSSDPAIKPYFSSGTILDVVYEITTAAVLRTGTTNPRVQIDNSGIFAYDSGGVARFTVDVATGQLTATKGTFSGTVSASLITAGTVSSSLVSSGTVSSNLVTGGTLTANQVTSGTITGNRITAGTITGVSITGNTISAGTVSGGTITGGYITGGTVNSPRFTGTINCNDVAFTDGSGGTPLLITTLQMTTEAIASKNIFPRSNNTYTIGNNSVGYLALVLSSPNGNRWILQVDNSGVLNISAG